MAESTTIIVQNLLERLKNGDDAEAKEELIRCAQRRLDALTKKMMKGYNRVHRWEGVSDVRQNASVRLWRAIQNSPPDSVSGFFRLAATQIRRELIDMARHYYGPEGSGANHQSAVREGNSESSSAGMPEAVAREADVRELAEWTEFHERVDQLPEEERSAYDLLWYQELTHEEAAEVLQISVWTLRRHFRNAKLRLHSWLQSGQSSVQDKT